MERLDFCATLIGMILVYAGKLWFIDRMVWLCRDMSGVRDADSQKEA